MVYKHAISTVVPSAVRVPMVNVDEVEVRHLKTMGVWGIPIVFWTTWIRWTRRASAYAASTVTPAMILRNLKN